MRGDTKCLSIVCGLLCWASAYSQQFVQNRAIQLASPKIESQSIFFAKRTLVKIGLAMDHAVVRYTLDGQDPTESSAAYTGTVLLDSSAMVKAKAWHPDFRPSEVVELAVHKLDVDDNLVLEINPNPSETYPGNGTITLLDNEKGSLNFRDGKWLGFSSDTITIDLAFKKAVDMPLVNFSVLEDQASWIFMPASIEVWLAGELVTLWEKDRFPDQPKSFQYIQFTIPKRKVKEATVKVIMNKIPAWHPGAGTIPWFFVDEIFISK